MINNRQGGRRRGRGGQRQGGGGQPGNRQDNRQRGNAAQLLEKYKSLARDSQLSGDRVQTEYYLQYADHYFRLLNENKSRFEDQRRPRGDDLDEDDGEDNDLELIDSEGGDEGDEQDDRQNERQTERQAERSARRERPRRDDSRPARRESRERVNGDAMPFDALPPSIGGEGGEAAAEEAAAPKPRRRRSAARPAEDEGEVAPAA